MIDMTFELRTGVYYITLEDGRTPKVSEKEINRLVTSMDVDIEEAIEIWLDDEGYTENEDQEELTQKAKDNKILSGLVQAKSTEAKKERKPRTVAPNPTKEMVIERIAALLPEFAKNVEIQNKSKLIGFTIGDEIYTINLVQKRKKDEKKEGK